MRRRSERRQEQIRALVAEQEASGLTVAAFARKRAVSAWALYDWKRRTRHRADPRPEERVGFVQVKVADPPRGVPTLWVELSGGLRVHVPAGFDAGELRRLIEVLSPC
jgi:hypothetical protein